MDLSSCRVQAHLLFPHDQMEAMHSWWKYNRNDAVLAYPIQGTPGQTILWPMTLTYSSGVCQVSPPTIHHLSIVFDYNFVGG